MVNIRPRSVARVLSGLLSEHNQLELTATCAVSNSHLMTELGVRIAVIGGGYVGLVSGACFAEFGTDMTIVETDAKKLAALRDSHMPVFKPGLEGTLNDDVRGGRLKFTANLTSAVDDVEVVFIAVGTPAWRGDGHADLMYVLSAAEQVVSAFADNAKIVTDSIVPVGIGRSVRKPVAATRPTLPSDARSSPEFLREGSDIGELVSFTTASAGQRVS